MAIDCTNFWPNLVKDETITHTYSGGIVNEYFSVPKGGTCLRQTINGVWDSDWFYRFDNIRGVLEYKDTYPKKGFKKLAFWTGLTWPSIMLPGKEIIWGHIEQIGKTIEGQCVIAGPISFFPKLGAQYGWQKVEFLELLPTFTVKAGTYKNVLVINYIQSWGNKPSGGGKLWLAPGLGQLRAEWTTNGMSLGYSMELQSSVIIELIK